MGTSSSQGSSWNIQDLKGMAVSRSTRSKKALRVADESTIPVGVTARSCLEMSFLSLSEWRPSSAGLLEASPLPFGLVGLTVADSLYCYTNFL